MGLHLSATALAARQAQRLLVEHNHPVVFADAGALCWIFKANDGRIHMGTSLKDLPPGIVFNRVRTQGEDLFAGLPLDNTSARD